MGRAGRTGHGAQRARDGVDGQPIRTGQVAKHRPMRGGLGVTGGGSWRPSPAHRRSGRLPCSPPRSPVAGTGRSPGRLPAAVAVHNAGLGARRILVESCAQDTQDLAALTGALAHIGAPTTVRARVDRRHAHELRWDGDLIAYADTAGGQLRRERLGGHRGAVRQRSAKDSGPLPPPAPHHGFGNAPGTRDRTVTVTPAAALRGPQGCSTRRGTNVPAAIFSAGRRIPRVGPCPGGGG